MRSTVGTYLSAIRSVRNPFLVMGVATLVAAVAIVAVVTMTRSDSDCDPASVVDGAAGETVVCTSSASKQSTNGGETDEPTDSYPITAKSESDSNALVVPNGDQTTDSADSDEPGESDNGDPSEVASSQQTTSTAASAKPGSMSAETSSGDDSGSSSPSSNDSNSSDSNSTEPESGDAKSGDTQSGDTQSGDTKSGDTKSGSSTEKNDRPGSGSKGSVPSTTVAEVGSTDATKPSVTASKPKDPVEPTPTTNTSSSAPASAPAPGAQKGSCRNAPALPAPSGSVVRVSSEPELQAAVGAATSGTTILIKPGVYSLSSTLIVKRDGITIRGDSARCDAVVLKGRGMDNANYGDVPHGIWTNAKNLAVQNLTVTDVYYHAINLNYGSESPSFYNLMLLDTGEQHLKANAGPTWGNGTDNGNVNYLTIGYPNGTPRTDHGPGTGYVQAIDVHGGSNWVIRNSHFFNFHTRDTDVHLWSPAILMWRGSKNTIIENNTFVDVVRSIALGLGTEPSGNSHSGGRVAGNTTTITPGLLSANRTANSDGAIIVWDSPRTVVENNTCNTNDNLRFCIEFRFNTTGSVARNNVGDKPVAGRDGAQFTETGTVLR